MQKRAFRKHAAMLCLAALAITILSPVVQAGTWRTKEIKWHLTSVGAPYNPTAIYNRDTTYNVVAASQVDTTGDFSLSDADIFRGLHTGAATTVDTVVAGYLMIQGDSSVAVGNTVTSVTIEVDGRVGGFGAASGNRGWTQVDSTVVTLEAAGSGTDGPTDVSIIPLRAVSGLGAIGGSANLSTSLMNQPYKIFACEDLRVRFTSVTGVVSAARIFLRWWDDSE